MLSTTNKCLIVLFAMCKNFQIYVEKKKKHLNQIYLI